MKASIEIVSFKRASLQGPLLWGIFKVGIEMSREERENSNVQARTFFSRFGPWVDLLKRSSPRFSRVFCPGDLVPKKIVSFKGKGS